MNHDEQGRRMRRLLMIVSVMALLPGVAAAQQEPSNQRPIVRIPPDYRGLSPEDMNAYCLWAGQLYSIGSAFCSRQQTQSTCTAVSGARPIWVNKENDKFCDRNPSLTPQ
jgi:hypothetical protein